jgi:hypothetical protein
MSLSRTLDPLAPRIARPSRAKRNLSTFDSIQEKIWFAKERFMTREQSTRTKVTAVTCTVLVLGLLWLAGIAAFAGSTTTTMPAVKTI